MTNFGYGWNNDDSANAFVSANNKFCGLFTRFPGGTITEVHAKMNTTFAVGEKMKIVVYLKTNGVNAAVLKVTSAEFTGDGTLRWYDQTGLSVEVGAGDLLIGIIDNADTEIRRIWDSSQNNYYNSDTYADGPANPFGSASLNTGPKIFAYVVYTPSGATYEINVDAVVKASATKTTPTTYSIEKDASIGSSGVMGAESLFNISKDMMIDADATVVVEKVVGLIEIFVDAAIKASAFQVIESTFSIQKAAEIKTDFLSALESVFNIAKDASVNVGATKTLELGISLTVSVQASTVPDIQSIFNIEKLVTVKVPTPFSIQTTFNVEETATINAATTFEVWKVIEVKVTKIFLTLGNIAIQLTG